MHTHLPSLFCSWLRSWQLTRKRQDLKKKSEAAAARDCRHHGIVTFSRIPLRYDLWVGLSMGEHKEWSNSSQWFQWWRLFWLLHWPKCAASASQRRTKEDSHLHDVSQCQVCRVRAKLHGGHHFLAMKGMLPLKSMLYCHNALTSTLCLPCIHVVFMLCSQSTGSFSHCLWIQHTMFFSLLYILQLTWKSCKL